jgi:uncharacterized protein
MLTGLSFEIAAAPAAAAPNRADVACFIGMVSRRPGVALPSGVRAQLRSSGWEGGPWLVEAQRVDSLSQLPVIVDSWDAFDRLFAWERRPVRADGTGWCATYLGAAVRSFFAQGGRRAAIIRAGDPWPYLGGPDRAAELRARLGALVPARAFAPRPFEASNPPVWRGIEHLYGLGEISHVCLPDLADICSAEPQPLPVVDPPPPTPEVFVECSGPEPPTPVDSGLRFVGAPRLDVDGFAAWAATVDAVREFLARHRRDALMVAALPLPHSSAQSPLPGGAHAQGDWLGFLRQSGVLEAEGANEAGNGTAASAFVQLAWPWLQTVRSDDLPQRLEPADGLLAGVLARNALARGTFRSIAGTPLPQVVTPEPVPDLGLGLDSPTARLAQRVCLIGPEPDGIAVLSDVTSAPDSAWRPGGVSRLMATLIRAALRAGEAQLFEANGPELWSRVRRTFEELLGGFYRAGALGGKSEAEAFQVRCDRSTMSQNDLDNGRLRAEITVLPAAAIERITVSLELFSGRAETRLSEVA